MKPRRIVIAGGTGFLGKILCQHFKDQNDLVFVLTRGASEVREGVEYVHWDGQSLGDWVNYLNDADALINLSGKSVDCRYTKENRQRIYDSRLKSTRALGLAMLKMEKPPRTWINATSGTIYRHAEDRPMTEADGEIGQGFSVDVCQKWERMFFGFELPLVRKAALRTTIVLGNEGGAFVPLKMMARLGAGGKHGNGKQMFSWIHAYDFCRAVQFVMDNNELDGVFNVAAPEQLQNHEVMKLMREVTDVPFGIPNPKWLLEIGAMIIGTETELLLKSRWVKPERLEQAGFQWEFANLEKAFVDLLAKPMFPVETKLGTV
jgi:uncharacterized protein